MNYDLNRLNPDGGREATQEGGAPDPSETNRWRGRRIFQAKFHNTYENALDKIDQIR